MNLALFQKYVESFCKEKGFEGVTIEQRMLFLQTEVGELAKEVLLHPHTSINDRDELKTRIGLEMFDIIWNVAELANKFDIDLEAAFKEKMEINRDRVW
ncbi:pyrophosphatase [Metabacillus herbersteinensis]|uniref:Pyrophosphatase n=1 Tax=Metabacillus herbersteinensis TaxID=283816 RepID=A0ABV6GFR5_9BACI